jgi:signal transduction histidine kinase
MNDLYMVTGMHPYRVNIFERFLPVIKKSNIVNLSSWYGNAVWANYNVKNYDKAREYMNYILDSIPLTDDMSSYMKTNKVQLEGQILMDEGKYTEAIPLLFETCKFYESIGNTGNMAWSATHLANCYYLLKDYKSALQYATLGYKASGPQDLRFFLKANLQLADIYEALGKKDSAYFYLRKYQGLLVESNILQNTNQILGIQVNSVLDKSNEHISLLEQESLLKEQRNKNQRLWIFSITGALLSALLIALILYRNNKTKQKVNTVLEHTLSNLKSTQTQLIQSEKMASLGELTAGIAHEIQNPLNFVNNFSEVNTELIDELKRELAVGSRQLAEELIDDIKANEEKIIHHGKRADAIVKGMLQHSRTSSGVKEPIDINALCDEYLRLSYHGLRAKDKSFNAKFETDFDASLPKINVVPQDIGRVVLNLINNAFYVVNEKKQKITEAFEPTVVVSTKKKGNSVLISVKDNGNGIPQSIGDKIFHPFFTTKPTGQGTGLGLSLSYDIVKAHGGELKVETKEGEGSAFIIQLPIV